MKRLVLVPILALVVSGMAFALLPSFGVKGGVNLAKFIGPDAKDESYKMGFAAGAFASINLMVLTIQPEILYTQKGSKELVSDPFSGNPDITYTGIYDYLEIPILAKFSFGKIIVPSIYFGPSFAKLMSAKIKEEALGISLTVDAKDVIKKTDVGLVFGAEVKTPIKLSVEARYTMGLNSIDNTAYNFNIKNSAISVMLGYYIF